MFKYTARATNGTKICLPICRSEHWGECLIEETNGSTIMKSTASSWGESMKMPSTTQLDMLVGIVHILEACFPGDLLSLVK